MKKWQYKIVPFKSLVENSSDHNIDVSVEEAKNKVDKSRIDMENAFNKLGNEGWELVGAFRDFALLKKEK